MQKLMEDPYIYMHGPEHHIMAGAALLAAYHNCGGQIDLKEAPGGDALPREQVSGRRLWNVGGCCGAAVSTGMFVSIVTKATPLTGKSWRLSNQMTARALGGALAELGGPRCCKRNCFTAVKEAVGFAKGNLGVEMELPEQIRCGFSAEK